MLTKIKPFETEKGVSCAVSGRVSESEMDFYFNFISLSHYFDFISHVDNKTRIQGQGKRDGHEIKNNLHNLNIKNL